MSSKFVSDILRSQDLDITESTCDLTTMFENIRVLNSATSSSTLQVFAKIKDRGKTLKLFEDYIRDANTEDVFIKIGFYEKGDNSAVIERMLYKYLKNLLWNMRTPNIMRYIAGFECSNFLRFLKEKKKEPSSDKPYYTKLIRKTESLKEKNDDIDVNKAVITVVELGKGMSFSELLQKGLNKDDFLAIMFQTFYTLRELFLNKVRHNDIHLGNIWINILPQPQRMIYFISDDVYAVLETKYLVKIYDFDRSAFTMGPISNTALKTAFCPQYGMCENENERYDITIVLNALNTTWIYKYGFVKEFVDKTFINKNILDTATFAGRYCEPVRGARDTVCSDNAVIKKKYIYNLTQIIINTNIFAGYTKLLSISGFEKRDVPITHLIMPSGVPMYAFKTNFYVSTKCKLTPIEMANKLLGMKSLSPKKIKVERKEVPEKIIKVVEDEDSSSSSSSLEESTEDDEESDHRFDEEIIDPYDDY